MSTKCSFYDKGYCKNKTKCSQIHPPLDCDGQCDNKITCPKRHRVRCKHGNSCIYHMCNSCEFLHLRNDQEEVREPNIEELQTNKQAIETKLLHIDSRLAELDAAHLESKIRVLESKFFTQIKDLELRCNESYNNIKKVVELFHEEVCAVINNSELQTGNHKETNIDEYKSRRESFNNAP